MDKTDLNAISTSDGFRRMITAIRAAHTEELEAVAPVIDITTRRVLR